MIHGGKVKSDPKDVVYVSSHFWLWINVQCHTSDYRTRKRLKKRFGFRLHADEAESRKVRLNILIILVS